MHFSLMKLVELFHCYSFLVDKYGIHILLSFFMLLHLCKDHVASKVVLVKEFVLYFLLVTTY
jgi:hypothetical protein